MADLKTDQEEMEEEIDEENNGDESEVSKVEEDEENDTRLSSRNTNKRSWIWGHFKYENSLKKAKCDYCKSLICCNKGSTTGLLNYLKSANIKEAFLKSLSSYNIESKILSVTTYNASNNITFLQAVEDELSKKFIQFESKDKHVHCLAHVMNLAVQQALTTLKAIEDNEPSNENSGGSLIHKPINTLSNSDQNLRALSINEKE
ncbi:unnamed protein product [Rhizophagus irregularis]|nr:unnamed protein product [Rhizophagus irregularis]